MFGVIVVGPVATYVSGGMARRVWECMWDCTYRLVQRRPLRANEQVLLAFCRPHHTV